MKNLLKKIIKTGIYSLGLLSLVGSMTLTECNRPVIKGNYHNHPYKLVQRGNKSILSLGDKLEKAGIIPSYSISFTDLDSDGKFDRINTSNINDSASLKEYANFKTAQKILAEIKKDNLYF